MLSARLACRAGLKQARALGHSTRCAASAAAAEPLPAPTSDGCNRQYGERVTRLVDEIASLTLVEVADLNAALKARLNLPDVPMGMPMMAAPAAGPAASAAAEEEPQQTSFTVKLLEFNAKKKIPVIKEIKAIMDGFNLVQAKKFVEAAPQVVREDVGVDEAKQLKERLEKCGAKVELV